MPQHSASHPLPDASAKSRPLHFIFVERGQRIPTRRPPRTEHEVVIVGESPEGASTRHAIQRIARFEREGRRVRQSEILVAPADSAASPGAGIESRAALAIALVRHMAKAGTGDLTFVVEESCSRALRSEVLALVDTLLAGVGATGIGLHVQFGLAPRPLRAQLACVGDERDDRQDSNHCPPRLGPTRPVRQRTPRRHAAL